jgi:hypothetical protein
LFLYNRMAGCAWDQYFACPRIDDLECAWTSMQAFAAAPAAGHVNMCAVFDNEEVGSSSKQGADSTFLTDVCMRIAASAGLSDAQARAAIAGSFMVSADNAHGVHPNHPEKYDMGNRTFLNGGVVIKHNANQKYTTDGVSAAVFASVCEKAGVPVQHFANRSDVLGGSTQLLASYREAISKATAAAKKAMVRVPLREGRTLHHDGKGHFGAGLVTVRSAPQGTGIIAGGPMRAVFESLGVADVVTKSVGTSNPYNMIRATFEALTAQVSPKSVAQRRGKKIADLLGRGGSQAAEADAAAIAE